jgi:hypothetical protein
METKFKKRINRWTVPGPNPAQGLALLAQTTAKNGLIGPTPAARQAHTLARSLRGGLAWRCGVSRLVVRSSRWVPQQQGGGIGQVGGEGAHPGGSSIGRWQKTAARGGLSTATTLRWTLLARVRSHGYAELRRVWGWGRLTGKDLGGHAHHGLAVGGGSGSESGDDGSFPMAMLGQEDKGRLRASHELLGGEENCAGQW